MTEEELPPGWGAFSLDEFCEFQSGGKLKLTKADYVDRGFPAFSAAGQDGFVFRKEFEKSAVVLSSIGARCGKAFLANGEWTSLANTQCIFPNQVICDVIFLWYQLNDEDSWPRAGSAQPFIKPATIRSRRVVIAPLNEQRRIVERIDELFSQIEAGEAALARAKRLLARYRQAVLKAAVTGGLTKDWRERHPTAHGSHALQQIIEAREKAASATGKSTVKRHHIPEEHKFPVPDTWAWCSIEDAGDVQLGQQRAPQHHSGDHMRPYLRVANVFENKLDLSDVKTMNFMPSELAKFELRPGDILLNEGQSPDKLGRSAIYSGEIDGCCIQKTLLRFRAYSGLHPRFAQIVFRFYMNFERFKRIARITTNIGHLTRVRFVEMEFPVPPTEEQQLIADRFDALDTNIDSLIEAVPTSFSVALRQAILTAAFAGKLVPQDPADEPAAALLDRIRAERPTTPAT